MAQISVKEKKAKSILSKSKVSDYTVNPYTGCEHKCEYCYARFMKRYTGHQEEWGGFVDVKINAPELLEKELERKKPGKVWISGVCDPYQPIEEKYRITRSCLEVLQRNNWPIIIQTKSPLVTRDIDILRKFKDAEVGLTIPTWDEKMKKLFEPKTPSISKRIKALELLHNQRIKTYVMIAPILPGADKLVNPVAKFVDRVLIDKMNYRYADKIYKENNLEYAKKEEFFFQVRDKLVKRFKKAKPGLKIEVLF